MDTQMTIGAFARRTGLSASALRFYDRRGLLSPARVDPTTGYRHYDATQIEIGELIRALRLLDVPLAEIAIAVTASAADRRTLVAAHLDRLDAHAARVRTHARRLRVLDPEDTTMTTTTSTDELATALRQVLPAASTDPEQPHLMTVRVAAEDDALRLVATDRHRLALRDLPTDGATGAAVVVSAAILTSWATQLDDRSDTEVVARLDGDGWHVEGPDVDLTAAALPVEFPDHRAVLETRGDAAELVVDRASMLEALDNVGIEATVQRSDGDGAVLAGDGVARPLTTVGEVQDFPAVILDVRYMREAIERAVGPEVVLEITGPLEPVLFRSADDGTYLSLVMPIAP